MVSYSADGKHAWFYGRKFTRDDRTGYYLETKPVSGKRRKRLHVAVWEHFNGAVPDGMDIHHINGNKYDNELDNLCMMSSSAHSALHGLEPHRRAACRRNMMEKAMPAAMEWHGSNVGREWHRKHYEQTKARLCRETVMTCQYCGKDFLTVDHGTNRFCSGKCRAAYRRRSGVDDEKRTCAVCGKQFTVNRYSTVRTCSRECGRKMRYSGR